MLKISFALSNFELTSKISTQSRTQIKKRYPSKQKISKNEHLTPKDTHHNASIFIDLAQNDLNKEKEKKKKNPKPNLFKGEQKAMEELAKRKYIIINNADKGRAVVIMDVEKYINESNRQLSDKRNYKKLKEDPTLRHSNLVNDTIDRFKKENILSKNPQSFT